ncbi:MAG TPA: hypothetical protein PLY93_07290 [Turneriella sp.]|nr:hypothetical protein [Turneriella sp.]
MLLKEVAKIFSEKNIPYAVVGGYAVNLYGFVRSTLDLDILLPLQLEVFQEVERCMAALGLICRVPIDAHKLFQSLDYYRHEKNMVVWSFYSEKKPWLIIDFLLTDDLRDFEIETKILDGISIAVITLEGLITLKKKSARRQDLEDIRALEQNKK